MANSKWQLQTDSGWVLCHRQSSETPSTGFKTPPYILKKPAGSNVVEVSDKKELEPTQSIWNDWCVFDPMKVKPKKISC